MKHWIWLLEGCKKAIKETIIGFFKFMVAFYRIHLSGYFGGVCRFQPSCSVYSEEVFQKHPNFFGIQLVFRRLCRCHPFGSFGHDPVPSLESENCCAK